MYLTMTSGRLCRGLALLLTVLLWLGVMSPAMGGTVPCTTYEEKTLQRWHTICDDGTRAVSRYNRI